jgi:hypothetical protein
MKLSEHDKKITMLKKELKNNYEQQKKLGIVGGARTNFLNYTKKMINDLDQQSQKSEMKNKFDIIRNQKMRLNNYIDDNFFFF